MQPTTLGNHGKNPKINLDLSPNFCYGVSMDTIVFDSGVAICKREPETRDDPEIEFPVDSLIHYLNSPVVLKPVTTFAHVWDYLERDAEFFGNVFYQAMGGFSIQEYIKQARKPHTPDEDEDPQNCMVGLSVGWATDIWEDEINIFTDFGGFGPQTIPNGDGTERVIEGGWAVEMTPINELLHYPLSLDDGFVVREESTKDYKELWKGKREWTVYDMYYAILFEITFCGVPNDQIRKVAELDQTMAEVKDAVAKGNFIDSDRELDEEIED